MQNFGELIRNYPDARVILCSTKRTRLFQDIQEQGSCELLPNAYIYNEALIEVLLQFLHSS